eukprot:COSAG02_NODE_6462_length_3555_cov_18.813082_1_plen_991_part_00
MSEDARSVEQAESLVVELQAQLKVAQEQRDNAVAPYVDRTSRALRLLKESHTVELTRLKRQLALLDATHRSETADLRARIETVRAERAALRQGLLKSETARSELEAELRALQAGERTYGQTSIRDASGGATFPASHELPTFREVSLSVQCFISERYGQAALHAFGRDVPVLLSAPKSAPLTHTDHDVSSADPPEAVEMDAGHAQIDPEPVSTGTRLQPATDKQSNGIAQVSTSRAQLGADEPGTQGDGSDTEEEDMGSPHSLEEVPLSQLRHQIDEAIGHSDHIFVLRTLIDARQSAEFNTLGACLEALTSYETTFEASSGPVSNQIERLRSELEKVELEHSASQRAKMEENIKAMEVDINHLKALYAAGLLADKSKLSELEQQHRAAVYKMHRQASPSVDDTTAVTPQPLQLDPRIKTHAIGTATAVLRPNAVASAGRGTSVLRRLSVSQSPRSAGSFPASATPRSRASETMSAPASGSHGFGLGRRVRGGNTRLCKDLGVPMPPGKPTWLQMPSAEAVGAAFAVLGGDSGDELTRVERVAGMVWEGFQHTGAVKRACDANQSPLSSPEQLSTLLRYVRFFTYHWTVLDDVETIDGSQMTVQAFKDGCEAVGYVVSASEAAATYIDLDKADTGFVTFSDFCSFLARRIEAKEGGAQASLPPAANHPKPSPSSAARPVRTTEFSLSDIEAEIAGMIAAEKGVVSIAAGGQAGSGSSASMSPTGARLETVPQVSSSQSTRESTKLKTLGEDVQVLGHAAESEVEAGAADLGSVPETQRESQRESEANRMPEPEQMKPDERTKHQLQEQELQEPQLEPGPKIKQELQQPQLASQTEQQTDSGLESESEVQPEQETALQPEPEPQPKLQLESKPQQSSRSVMPGATVVPEGVPPSGNGDGIDMPGKNGTHMIAEVAVDAGRSRAPLSFESLVPADLRADLDRATQLEADGKLREALATYTDCIRRLAPIYKRKSIRTRLHTSNACSVRVLTDI